jgi:flagellar FliJ protein
MAAQGRSKGLQSLIKIAKNAANEALGYVGSIQQQIEQEKEKEKTLVQYESEYQSSFLQKGKAGVQGTAIEQHEGFMIQIQQALNSQAGQVEKLQEQLKKAQEVYANLNQKLKSYEKLEQRISEQALQRENKAVQNMLDEIAMQLHRRQ